jgi:hypothetical protein
MGKAGGCCCLKAAQVWYTYRSTRHMCAAPDSYKCSLCAVCWLGLLRLLRDQQLLVGLARLYGWRDAMPAIKVAAAAAAKGKARGSSQC